MHSTHNSLPAPSRKKVIAVLTPLLTDTTDLRGQVKQAHWNVRGNGFQTLHELFDSVAKKLDEVTDEIAERIVQLGGEAPGTVHYVARHTRLKDYPLLLADGDRHIEALATALAKVTSFLRDGIDAADAAEDAVTADLLTRFAGDLDKLLWFIEAHQSASGVALSKVKG